MTWRYDHGAVISEEKAAKIDAVIATFQHKNPKGGKYSEFLLTGILAAPDGSRYQGNSAKGGANFYYVNPRHGRRFRRALLDDVVVARLQQYLHEGGLVQKVYEKSLRHGQVGAPSLKQELAKLTAKKKELEDAIAGFSRSVRELAVSGAAGHDFGMAIEALVQEKKAAENELATTVEHIKAAETKEQRLKATLEGQTFLMFLRKTMSRFDELPGRERKRAIQSFLTKAVVLDSGELELHIIPDPGNPAAQEVIRAGRTPKGLDRNVEDRSSEFLRTGGPNTGQLELSYSAPKLTDIVELPGDRPYQNSAVLHQKYVVERATMAQIAKEFLCSKCAIRGALVKAGIPLRRRAQPGFASVAYGARVVKGRRVECPAEQRVIATITDLRGDGMSFDKIAGFLTKMGVPTKTRRRKWNGGCVRQIYLAHSGDAGGEA